MPAGSGAQIGITRSDSLYLSIQSVNFWTDFVSETVEHNIAILEDISLNGYKDSPPSYKGVEHAVGDINFEPKPNALGAFLRGAFGQASGTILTNAGSWGANSGNALNLPTGISSALPVAQHTFVPIQTAADPFSFLPEYTMMIYKDQGSAWFYQGTVYHNFEFQITAGQLVKTKVSAMARKIEQYARTSSIQALRSTGGQPWTWDQASIQTGPGVSSLAARAIFEDLTITLDVPIEGVILLDGTKNYAEFQVNGFRKVTLSGKMSFRDQLEYQTYFVPYISMYLRCNFSNINSSQVLGNPSSAFNFALQLDIPQVKITKYAVPVRGPNRLQVDFTGKAEFDPTSLYQIQAQLTNTTSAY